ncbi:cupin domain-containing protein [Runella slithyformis]|uniref:Cupin 2 conserved barrel domain protein n=1 Tax=Runella slithyformis (strain ATCC 29530 / DSM 19594 / LMG 11500 / NCIMB 11436 / LSU 4) TaxID=761193 RepID=A0A7U4E3Z0_RUNSL|nr:cupin domain-containing protein [Runella slithyformis]AEI46734.1 Cupin 2 conserved barrel domain protein [Runella slithyformis DSM 19594]
MFSNKVSLAEATDRLRHHPTEFLLLFQNNTLEVELYKPDVIDKQTPHDRDEVYVIASGEATFELEEKTTEVKAGDFLFVPAHAAHKFTAFSDDFSTWVLFIGPAVVQE